MNGSDHRAHPPAGEPRRGMNGGPMGRPGVNGGPAGGPALPLQAVEQFLIQSLPLAAVAHSFHVDAMRDPRLHRDPAIDEFNLIELNELHHQVAALGALLRMQQGDASALASLGYNLAGFLENREAALRAGPRLPPTALQNPAMRQVMALIQQTNQMIQQYMPAIMQTIQASGVTDTPGPLLIGRPE